MTLTINESIRLASIDESHAHELFALIESSRKELGAWLPWVPYMKTIKNFIDFTDGAMKRNASGAELGMTIFYEGAIAGRAGIYYIDRQNKTGALGYWIGTPFAGKGIITACCKGLVQHAFTNMDLNRIELKCAAGNTKSAAVAERLGFTREGILREAEWLNDQPIDLLLFSLLKKSWKEA